MPERIYLIGMPGCGKSKLGKSLAKKLDWNFIDLDAQIERSVNKSISEIFVEDGEFHFREIERKELHKTSENYQTIIACGGGTPCYFDNLEWMKKEGYTVYLYASTHLLLNRILSAKTVRPLFLGLDSKEILHKITELLAHRKPFYERANQVILLPSKSVETSIIKGYLAIS